MIARSSYSGPMPAPELLRAYAEVAPDLPMRMMAMAEKAQDDAHAAIFSNRINEEPNEARGPKAEAQLKRPSR